MLKHILLGAVAYTGATLVSPPPAYAQDTGQQGTRQTDQSEEDWRNSRRKRTNDRDIESIINPGNLGSGPVQEYEPIDALPEESQRHLKRQRAKVIAEMEFGEDVPDVPFEPSDAAKEDPNLAAEEEEAWEVILTDLQGGSASGGQEQGPGGPNKVAVAGRGGGGNPNSVTRGGSAQSASDILNKLKGLQSSSGGGANGSGSGGSGGGVSAPQGAQGAQGNSPSGQGQAQTGAQDGNGSGQKGQDQSAGQSPQPQDGQQGQSPTQTDQSDQTGDSASPPPQAPQSVTRGGSSDSLSDILNQIKGTGGASGSPEDGQQSAPQSGQQGGQGSDGQSQSGDQAGDQSQSGDQAGTANDSDGDTGQSGADNANSRNSTLPEISPFTLPERTQTQGSGAGNASSASDFLKGLVNTPQTEAPIETEGQPPEN